MPDLVTFIRARLDDDERVARAGGEAMGYDDPCFPDYRTYSDEDTAAADAYLDRFSPTQALHEVAAKRQMLAAVERWHNPHPGLDCTNDDDPWAPCELHAAATGRLNPFVLELLAACWSGHPDYDPTWSTAA